MDQIKLITPQKGTFNPETKSVFRESREFLERKAKFVEERKAWRRKRK